MGLPGLRSTPAPASANPKTWTRAYRDKFVRPRVQKALELPWWAEHAAKPKHKAFLARAGPPGAWLHVLLLTAGEGAQCVDTPDPTGACCVGGTDCYDDLPNTMVIESYTTMDLRGAYHLHAAWHIVGKVTNLTDEDYENASYYRQPGRQFFVGLKWMQ